MKTREIPPVFRKLIKSYHPHLYYIHRGRLERCEQTELISFVKKVIFLENLVPSFLPNISYRYKTYQKIFIA